MQVPDDLDDWSLHCFCLGARVTPHALVRTHGRLLFDARAGVPVSSITQPELARLEASHLLTRAGDTATTAFPVLGPEPTDLLRRRAAAVAAEFTQECRAAASEVVDALCEEGFEAHCQAILFGHVLDGLAWHAVRRKVELPDTRLTPERPDWNGLFWASYPKAGYSGGTNELTRGRATLVMVWNERNTQALSAIAAAPETAIALAAISGSQRRAGLAGAALPVVGSSTVPWIEDQCLYLAEMISDRMAGELDLLARLAQFDVHLGESALHVIFGHELIWATAQAMIRGGWFTPPPADAVDPAMFIRID